MKWTDISVETYAFDASDDSSPVKTNAGIAKSVEITARRPYGNVTVKVDADRIIVQSQDGDGGRIEERILNLDDLVGDGKADDEDVLHAALNSLGTVPGQLQEAGMGDNPNPLSRGEPEGQEAGGQEEGEGQARPEGGRGQAG